MVHDLLAGFVVGPEDQEVHRRAAALGDLPVKHRPVPELAESRRVEADVFARA